MYDIIFHVDSFEKINRGLKDMDGTMIATEKIIEYLKPLKDIVSKKYNWVNPTCDEVKDLLDNHLITKKQYNQLIECAEPYSRNIRLKMILNEQMGLLSVLKKKELSKWIVKEWGGIKGLKRCPYELATAAEDNIKKQQESIFDNIATYSKVLSFQNINKYIIYDSRVAYSLNWILLKENATEKFFPIPSSRNRKISSFDFDVILKINNKSLFQDKLDQIENKQFINNCEKNLYLDKKIAYLQMCELLVGVNRKLWNGEKRKYPFYTEMILFAIADNLIIEDIINTVNLKIEDN
jgi:hypothetical protein